MLKSEKQRLVLKLSEDLRPEQLAEIILNMNQEIIEWMDNGCGNNLDFKKNLKRFLPQHYYL